jgi:hypothetical protein
MSERMDSAIVSKRFVVDLGQLPTAQIERAVIERPKKTRSDLVDGRPAG